MTGLYKSGSIFVEIIGVDTKYLIIRHIAGLKLYGGLHKKLQVKKYIKNLQSPSPEEKAKFLLLKHI